MEALAGGAFDYVPRQLSAVSLDIENNCEDLIIKIKAAAETCWPRSMARVARSAVKFRPRTVSVSPSVIAIGVSTGGRQALEEILPLLPADLAVGVLIVQHMPAGFTGPLARRLDGFCKVTVREANNHDVVEAESCI